MAFVVTSIVSRLSSCATRLYNVGVAYNYERFVRLLLWIDYCRATHWPPLSSSHPSSH